VISDIELLRKIARGDEQSLGTLYDAHGPRLLAIARRMLSSESDAEDLLHDVFVEVWKKAGDFDPTRGSVRTWIAMRVRSRCLDRLRSPRRRGQELNEAHMGATEMHPSLDADHLDAALHSLLSGQREVVVMAYIEGLSGPEISEALAIPLGTVKSRTAAALSKLRIALTDGDEGTP
jgi:RNA polymerase sigma-70 factor (ECF subfamily)